MFGRVNSSRQVSDLLAKKIDVATTTGALRQIIVVTRHLCNRLQPLRPNTVPTRSSRVICKSRVEGHSHQDVCLAQAKWTINIEVERARGNGGAGEDGGTLWTRRYTGDRLVTTGRTVGATAWSMGPGWSGDSHV